MKSILILTFFVILFQNTYCQFSSSVAYKSKVYSNNKKYFLLSMPFDSDFPTKRGVSFVCDSLGMIYKINRAFDLYPDGNVRMAISNDGKTVIYIPIMKYFRNFKDEEGLEYNKVVIYKDGDLLQSYSLEDFTGCDEMNETCGTIFYNNYRKVIDNEKTMATPVFKDGTSDDEKYLFNNYFVNINDTIYITDARKIVTIYDLHTAKIVNHIPFDSIYHKLKHYNYSTPEFTKVSFSGQYVDSLVNRENNELLSNAIQDLSGYRFIPITIGSGNDYYRFGIYRIKLSGFLNRYGSFDVDKIECDKELPKQKIVDYINSNKFKTNNIPDSIDKIYIDLFAGGYTFHNEKKAIALKKEQEALREKQNNAQSTQAYIEDVYIPKNLQECMNELDKNLNYESKQRLKNATSTFDFNGHGGGLGMWIRNSWGLHGNSRLYRYFIESTKLGKDENLGFIADAMSGTIIACYIEWLKGNKNICDEWIKQNKR